MASSLSSPLAHAPGHVAQRRQAAIRCSAVPMDSSTSQCSSRRAALGLAASLALPLLLPTPPALAEEEAGVNPLRAILRAPADFYRSRQQANGGAKILAPIRASRARLEATAALLAEAGDSSSYGAALSGVRAASLNCYIYEADGGDGLEARASLLQQQIALADPCTFRILHKNSLTLVTDPALEAEADSSLDALLRSFQLLDDMLDRAKQNDSQAAAAVPALLQQTIDSNLRFEAAVKACIGLEA